jgi:hypothetical protein
VEITTSAADSLGRGVSALVLRAFRLKTQVHEPGAKTFHLLLHRGPHIVRLHDRAEAPRRADCLQACHTRADDEDMRGGDRARRSHEEGEEPRQTARGDMERSLAVIEA